MQQTRKHGVYTFEYEPDLFGSVKITNSDGKQFYVMASALLAFMAGVVREQKIAKLEAATTNEILGLPR
jgi:hypothetical protein